MTEMGSVDKVKTLAQTELGLIWAKTFLSRKDLTPEENKRLKLVCEACRDILTTLDGGEEQDRKLDG
jgi:hypothetical protein